MNDIERAIDYIKNPLGKGYIDHERLEKITLSALEKQIPKMPRFARHGEDAYCPVCNRELIEWHGYPQKFCDDCGQAFDWSQKPTPKD